MVIALLHSAVIRDRICLSPDNAAAAAARFRQSWEPRRSISCEMFECEASEVRVLENVVCSIFQEFPATWADRVYQGKV